MRGWRGGDGNAKYICKMMVYDVLYKTDDCELSWRNCCFNVGNDSCEFLVDSHWFRSEGRIRVERSITTQYT